MDYYINPTAFGNTFAVPGAVVDTHFKFAKAEHIKILLYLLRNINREPADAEIAGACGVKEAEVKEALLYWADAGVLLPKNKPAETEAPKTAATKPLIPRAERPSRQDVARRGLEDPKIAYLLQSAQMKFGRNLKDNEANTFVWLYDDMGLDVSVILLIIQYAVSHNKANIRFVESVALSWIEKGITTIADADEQLRNLALGEEAWATVSKAFGLDRRRPSTKETDLALLWLNEWKMTPELLVCAYEECVNSKSKFSMPYIAKILESWHKKGYAAPGDIPAKKAGDAKDDDVSYDIDLFEKMLNAKD